MNKKLIFTALIGTSLLILVACGGSKTAVQGALGDPTAAAPNPTSSTTTSAPAGGMQVALESPAAGPVSNPLSVQANATMPNGVSGWAVYLDKSVAYQADTFSNSMTAPVTLPSGTHTLYVRAWDKAGAGFATSPTLQLDVQADQVTATQIAAGSANPTTVSSATAPSSALPQPPANAKVWTNIQSIDSGWNSCSACAGGDSVTSNFWTAAHQSSPSMTGSSREFFVGGSSWGAALWWKTLGENNWATHFLWDFYVRFDSTSAANAWTAEYDLWQSMNGQEFMIGSHCDFGKGHWDVYDSADHHWVNSGIACNRFSPGDWHHIQWYVERVDSHHYRYISLVVDGNAHSIDQTFATNSIGWPDNLGVQWQLDQNSDGVDLHEWVDQVKLTIW
ncbi:MAG: hypothetical protein ACR2IF_02710 [Terriglobales bacterium]